MDRKLTMAMAIIAALTLCFAGMSMVTGCDSVLGNDGGSATGDGGGGTDGGGGGGKDGGGGGGDGGGECTVDCEGKTCGQDDGCGGKCRICTGDGEVCNETTWTCEVCEVACEGKTCGQDDGCGGKCTDCAGADEFCNEDTWQCQVCTPNCENKVCGEEDGCWGYCDACPSGQACNPETLACEDLPSGCAGVTFEGCCTGTVLKYCDPVTDTLLGGDCSLDSNPAKHTCGWGKFNEGELYGCGGSGEDPSGFNPIACP